MARVYKPKNSVKWCCSIEVGTCGKRQRVVRGGFKTKKEAQQALADLQMKYYDGTLNTTKSKDILLKDFLLNVWLEHKKNYIKPSTLVNIKSMLLCNLAFFSSDIKLKDIRTSDCSRFIDWLVNECNLKRTTIVKRYVNIKMALDYAVETKLIPINYFNKLKLPPETNAEKEQKKKELNISHLYIEKNDLIKLIGALENPDISKCGNRPAYVMMTYLMLYTGMRIGEVCGLLWNDIDFNNRMIYIRHNYVRCTQGSIIQSPKTKSSIRNISIPLKISNMFLMYKKCYVDKLTHKSDSVFVSTYKKDNIDTIKPVSYSYWIKKISGTVCIDYIHPHIFRHTHASILLEHNIPMPVIAKRLGHTTTKLTEQIYTHLSKKANNNVSNILENISL